MGTPHPLNQNWCLILLLCFVTTVSLNIDAKTRVVASGGSVTEIIYGLNKQHLLVGVDSTSTYPEQARKLPQVGYVRRISTEGILSLEPTMLIGEGDTGPVKILEQLKQTQLPVHILEKVDDFAGIEEKIAIIADLLDAKVAGDNLIGQVKRDKQQIAHLISNSKASVTVLFILSFRGGKATVAGGGTSADDVINAAGGTNITGHMQGWKQISPEAMLELNPDMIVMMDRHGADGKTDLSSVPHLALLDATKNQRIYRFDGGYLLGMNPRTPKAVLELAKLIHN